MQIHLDNFSNWLINIRLSLNINKVTQITFFKRTTIIDTSYHISNTLLSRVSKIKEASKLPFASHINLVVPNLTPILQKQALLGVTAPISPILIR